MTIFQSLVLRALVYLVLDSGRTPRATALAEEIEREIARGDD